MIRRKPLIFYLGAEKFPAECRELINN